MPRKDNWGSARRRNLTSEDLGQPSRQQFSFVPFKKASKKIFKVTGKKIEREKKKTREAGRRRRMRRGQRRRWNLSMTKAKKRLLSNSSLSAMLFFRFMWATVPTPVPFPIRHPLLVASLHPLALLNSLFLHPIHFYPVSTIQEFFSSLLSFDKTINASRSFELISFNNI